MRDKRLDILRCLAVLLVIMRHSPLPFRISGAGWVGVDLFFVLSGFLISGLFFKEFKETGRIRFKRFFVRRALKIYPAFYCFLLTTAVISYYALSTVAPLSNYVREALFVMNYGPGVWAYTWSLAVEEHFYILLPMFLAVLIRTRPRGEMFGTIPGTFAVVAVACFASRMISVYVGEPNYNMAYLATHSRMDALFCGVFLGYLHHFKPEYLRQAVKSWRSRALIAVVSMAFLSTSLMFPPEGNFISTVGLTLMYLGFGGVLVLSLYVRNILPVTIGSVLGRLGTPLAYVGTFSYSIYLWHGPAGSWLPGAFRRVLGIPTSELGRFAVYLAGSLVIGIVTSKLVEYPILRMRDRLFPSGTLAADNALPVHRITPRPIDQPLTRLSGD